MRISIIFLLFGLSFSLWATAPQVEFLDQHYGPHERQTFDLWLPAKKKNAPLVIYIHGGGFVMGDKSEISKHNRYLIRKYNQAGVAFASINYRFLKHTSLQNIMREDIAGFVQYMRMHAEKFKISKQLVMPYGFSAGGSASLWLATHDDIALKDSPDRQKRQSSRVFAAGHLNAQVSYDYMVWYEFFGKENTDKFMGSQVWSRYYLNSFEELFTQKGIKIRRDLDSYGNLTADDCPIIFWNNLDDDETRDNNHFVHAPKHTRLLAEKARSLNLTTQVMIKADGTGALDVHGSVFKFFMERLKNHQRIRP